MGETDMVLMARYAGSRDAEAFAELAGRYAAVVYGTCLRVLGNAADAEDVAQDCFLELARHAPKVRGAGGSIAGFVHALARSRSVDFVKQASRRRKRERDAGGRVGQDSEWSAIERLVDAAMEELPQEMREVLVVHFLRGVTQVEMAEVAGVDQATISRRVARAVGILRDKLAGQGADIPAAALGGAMAEHALQQAPQGLRMALGKLALAGVGKAVTVGIGMKLAAAGLVAVAAAGTVAVVANRESASRPVAAVAATTRAVEVEQPSLEQARKALEADLEALRLKGEPVRPEDLARPSVSDAENAVLDLRAAVKSIDWESKAFRTYDQSPIVIPLSPQQTEVIRALVRETAPALKLIKSAMAKGKVDWRNKYTTPIIKVPLPDLADMRMLANLLQATALLAHEEGDDITALEHVRELLFVGRAAGDEPFLVSHLVEIGLDMMASDVCRQISPTLQLGKAPAIRDQLRRTIGELLDETDGSAHMRRAMQGERIEQVDTALALASGKLTAEELAASWEPSQPEKFKRLGLKPADVVLIALVDGRIMLGEMARVVDAASAADMPTGLTKIKPWPPAGSMEPKKHFYMAMMLSSLPVESGFATHYIGLATRRLAATALAIRWYAMDHDGKLPQTLQDLAPAYLPAVPADPMTVGASLIYSPDDEVVYSVGVNGKDDGGKPVDGRSRDGDIVMSLRQ